ncbi:hypothetical protein N507_2616 [Lacticaseibacillus rhamnosus DSM 14870]|nr:hypothetical protein N507_2616 [Lacticaseibacillus rhamnosus DSM 14870]
MSAFTLAGVCLGITRFSAQKPACKDLRRDGQTRPSRLRLLMFWFTPITRSPAQ